VGKRPVGRPRTAKRPTVYIRVHEPLYEKLRKSAADHRFTISEEAEQRLSAAFEWEEAFGEVKKWQAEAEAVIQRGAEAALRQWGYHKIRVDQGFVWAEPGPPPMRLSISLNAATVLRLMQEPAMVETFASVLEKNQSAEGDGK
jgi:hypothetical protein